METIALVDRDFRRRAAISHLLGKCGIHVEPFEDTAELRTRWPHEGVLLVHDEGENIATLLRQMAQAPSWLPLVGYDDAPAPRRIVQAVLAGAVDYLGWPSTELEIRRALSAAKARADQVADVRLREARARHRLERLTKREREVLAGVASGLSNRLIGERLEISPRTVEIHRANMLTKIGANHTSEAIRIAIEASLVG